MRPTPVFALAPFALSVLGVVGAPLVASLGRVFFGDRGGFSAGLATVLATAAAAGWAALAGGFGAALGRRLAFFEIAAATLLLLVLELGMLVHFSSGLGAAFPLLAGWEARGRLMVVIGLLLTGLLSGAFAFLGATLCYLHFGSGRFDPSWSYEFFVAKRHLRLSPRALAALFVLVVTGVVPGILVALGRSLWRDACERRSARRGEVLRRNSVFTTLIMTLVSIGSVGIGVCALTVVLSVMNGFEADLKEKILGANAHGVVLKYGANDFTEWQKIRKQVLSVSGVDAATPFLSTDVMVSANGNLAHAVANGIDTGTAERVSDLSRNTEKGRVEWLHQPQLIDLPAPGGSTEKTMPPSLPGVVVGRELAGALGVSLGDTVSLVSLLNEPGDATFLPRSRLFRVVAIFFYGMYEYDSKFVYLDLGEAQRFFGAGQSVTGLALKMKDAEAAPAVMRRILVELEGYPYRSKDWSQMNRNLFAALMMQKLVMALILGVIVLVASFVIVATLIMLVLERSQEIAVLKAMGAGLPSIMKIFVAEGLIIGAIGTILGLALGYGSCLAIERFGVPLDRQVYYISHLSALVDWAQYAVVALAAMALSYLATIYPAARAASLRPVEGLRVE